MPATGISPSKFAGTSVSLVGGTSVSRNGDSQLFVIALE
ncbi:hypothetical protein ND16A_1883 [Thalassotalea sp. ND16A]|nr:hypothetical protein ND16A_1883 [Thalassotalea sp. ND16A]